MDRCGGERTTLLPHRHQTQVLRGQVDTRRQQVGQGTTRQNKQQQIPAQRQAKAERDHGSSEQEARCEVLPTQDGTLPRGQYLQWTTRSQTPSAGGGGVTTRPKHESICSRTARSGKASRRLWAVVREETGEAKTGSRTRSSSPTRCSREILDCRQQRKSDGQRAHRWRTRNHSVPVGPGGLMYTVHDANHTARRGVHASSVCDTCSPPAYISPSHSPQTSISLPKPSISLSPTSPLSVSYWRISPACNSLEPWFNDYSGKFRFLIPGNRVYTCTIMLECHLAKIW